MQEIGTIAHEGREFSSGGASVNGGNVTGYTKYHREGRRYVASLKTWHGKTMLTTRYDLIEEYQSSDWNDDGGEAILFRLTNGRGIAGYSLGEGMLFRGELISLEGLSEEEVQTEVKNIAEYWRNIDFEDYERDQYEQSQEEIES